MKRKIIFAVIALMMVTPVALAEPLSVEKIACSGCYNTNIIPDGFMFWIYPGKNVVLTAIAEGGTGSKNFQWKTREGEIICNSNSCNFNFVKDVEYVLVAKDAGGSVSYAVELIAKSESSCFPSFESDIIFHDPLKRKEFSAGDKIVAEVRLSEPECSNVKAYWESDNQGISLAETSPAGSKTKKADLKVKNEALLGVSKIRFIITDGIVVRKKEATIRIVRNTPPSADFTYRNAISFSVMAVDCSESKTGIKGNENNDFIKSCYAELKDEKGNIVDRAQWEAKSAADSSVSAVNLKTKNAGLYNLSVKVTDSHGVSSMVASKEIIIGETGSKKDPLVVDLDDRIYCKAGEECKISALKTFLRYDKGASFDFYDVTKGEEKRLSNSKGGYCSGSPVCNHIFEYPEMYSIRIKAFYLGRTGYKDITVVVAGPSETAKEEQTIPVYVPTMKEYPQEEPSFEIPATGAGLAIFAVIFMAYVFRKKKK